VGHALACRLSLWLSLPSRHSSSVSRAKAHCSRVTTSGGQSRRLLSPAPSTQQAALERHLHHAVAQLRRLLTRLLDRVPARCRSSAPSPTNIAHLGEAVRPLAHAVHQVRAHARCVRDQTLLRAARWLPAPRASYRIATEGGSVRAPLICVCAPILMPTGPAIAQALQYIIGSYYRYTSGNGVQMMRTSVTGHNARRVHYAHHRRTSSSPRNSE